MNYDDWKSTDHSRDEIGSTTPNPYPGLRPMSEAPRGQGYLKPIIGVLHDADDDADPRVTVFHSIDWEGRESWFDANGDGADGLYDDGPRWRNWDTDEFAGWLPVPEEKT
jgi:hypothetical protein